MRKLCFCIALVAVTACNREHADLAKDAPSGAKETATANPQAGASQDTALNPTVPINSDSPTSRIPAATSETQTVELLEYQIHPPQTLRAGKQTLTLVNAGKEKHAFAIEGTSVKSAELSRGDSASLEVDLKPGTYTVYCPVDGHRGKGMTSTITVHQ